MTYEQAVQQAHRIADTTKNPTLVYRAKHNKERENSYGTAFTQPLFAVSIERVYPSK
jgi:hypothetical protein